MGNAHPHIERFDCTVQFKRENRGWLLFSLNGPTAMMMSAIKHVTRENRWGLGSSKNGFKVQDCTVHELLEAIRSYEKHIGSGAGDRLPQKKTTSRPRARMYN
ncbi:MAG: hypothetical protein GY759_13725 [Chloroflexi bacterium]|nr:hypothetical protein [Chloroflexota bacterium]